MQRDIIGLIYEITGNPYFGSTAEKPADRISEFPKPYEINELTRTLKALGFGVEVIDGPHDLLARCAEIRRRCTMLFNKSIGFRGLERKIVVPAICQLHRLPILGSTAYGMTLARHKYHTNRLLAGFGLRVPHSVLVEEGDSPSDEELAGFRQKTIVKPNHESDSLGIDEHAVCDSRAATQARVAYIHERFRESAVVEDFIGGEEWKVAVIGNRPEIRALGCVGVMKNGRIMSGSVQTRQDVVEATLTYYVPTPAAVVREAMNCAAKVHGLLGLRDYSRCDFRLDEQGVPFCMEVSTHPDLDSGCSFAAAATQSLHGYSAMVSEIVRTAMAREYPPVTN